MQGVTDVERRNEKQRGGGAYHDTNLSSHNDESRRGKHGHVLQDEMIKKSAYVKQTDGEERKRRQ